MMGAVVCLGLVLMMRITSATCYDLGQCAFTNCTNGQECGLHILGEDTGESTGAEDDDGGLIIPGSDQCGTLFTTWLYIPCWYPSNDCGGPTADDANGACNQNNPE